MFKNVRFEKLLIKATSELLMDADWETNLQICDLVRGQEVSPKYAVSSLKKKLNAEDPHVLMLGLSLLESMMKNCGTPMHEEVAGTNFVLDLLEYIHCTDEVRTKIFDLVQNWEYAFKDNHSYRGLHEAFREIKNSGHELPPFVESQAMFAADVAPGWKDGDVCFRCKISFSTFRRKHHCRNCGNVFCGECTAGRAVIPKFGIEREVRVCEDCLHNLVKTQGVGTSGSPSMHHTPTAKEESKHANQNKAVHDAASAAAAAAAAASAEKAARDKQLQLQEEEELQLALALSASEAESKQKPGSSAVAYPSSNTPIQQPAAFPTSQFMQRTHTPEVSSSMNGGGGTDTMSAITDVDPELARYLNRNYWTNRATGASDNESILAFPPSAPPIYLPPVNPDYEPSLPDTSNDKPPGFKTTAAIEMPAEGYSVPGVPTLTSAKQEEFLSALQKSIDVFVNRMRVNSQRGRPVANDSTLQTLFQTLHAMHPQLLQYSNELEQRRAYMEKLQDDTVQLREAREALDALRRDHAEQRRLKEEEANRQRQIQMMQKVEVLRQQKRDAMEAQRRLALEQTMQYQQQYQYQMQQPYVGIDPNTGMPMNMMLGGYSMLPAQPGVYLPGMEYAGAYGPPPHGSVYEYAAPQLPSMEQGPSEPMPEESNQQQPVYTMQGGIPSHNEETKSPYGMQNMIQALPPPTEAPRQYIPQPGISEGGGLTDPAAVAPVYPEPPSEDPQLDPQGSSMREDEVQVKKPATPAQEQLICFE